MSANQKTIILALTGASGVQYGARLLEVLLAKKHKVYLLITRAAQVVIKMETTLDWPADNKALQKLLCERYAVTDELLKVCGESEWTSPIASGSSLVDAMVVCPCSMGSLSSIAAGASANLMERAADVMLKERKKLILVPRETPFSDIHLENMLKLSRMGVVILPPSPGFYNQPQTIEDVIDFVVAKILDHLAIEQNLQPRWGDPVK
jgi:4-hydroxy-3-polyprenylbenzoate decarboxylase